MKTTIFFLCAMLLPASFLFARELRLIGAPAAVRLIAPNETAVVSPAEGLEFRWGPEIFPGAGWVYDLRIYRGPSMVASTLIFKAKLPPEQTSIRVRPDLFEEGRLYAWSVRITGPAKSRSNHSLFKAEFRK